MAAVPGECPSTLPAGFKVTNNPSASDDPVVVFETLADAQLDPGGNQMSIYDWGNTNCCLSKDSFSTALAGSFEHLKAGDYILFDAGRNQRDVVRLTVGARRLSRSMQGRQPRRLLQSDYYL